MQMTSRQRWLAAVDMKPVDRLPLWPKIGGAYRQAQAASFQAMEADALHAWIGSDPHEWVPGGPRETRTRTSAETMRSAGVFTMIHRTSAGVMPPFCKPETIRQVCEWVTSYPVRVG